MLCALYRRIRYPQIRRILIQRIKKFDGTAFYSQSLRQLFREVHNVNIGLYTHGGCFDPLNIDAHTTIGRYSSFGRNVRVIALNHPMEFKSTHGFFFYNGDDLNLSSRSLVDPIPHYIGNDVWIGDNAIILPSAPIIGDGAVIAAGAVVNKNVPPYAVVVGNPARVVRYRFSEGVVKELLESKWWEQPIEEILPRLEEYQRPYEQPVPLQATDA